KASRSNITFLILYVDDILIMGNSIPMIQSVKTYLEKCFAMKDLGEAAYILGIKIYRDRSKRLIGLCQSDYIEKILKRYCMENFKRGSIPMQEKLKLSKSQGASTPAEMKRMQNVPYASAVGSIMYAVRFADIRAIRILIAIAVYYDYEIWQMYIKTAFLNGYLNEEYSNTTKCKTYLGKCFAIKDLGEAAYILGIKIYRDRSKRLISLCQSAYIEKILKRYCMRIPNVENVPYASAVRSIMCAMRCTRADVAFAQNITSRFQQNPVYGCDLKRELRVSCYTDAGYLTDFDDLKSQTGYVFVLNGGVVDWKSAKQSIFATSSAEAEYIAAFDASKEAVWVRKFISGLRVVLAIEEPIIMYCDNIGAITIANESGIMKGARHFRAKVPYLREVIELG
nr:hypothetical protein [Tanacetum cinerariifolium]